MYITIIHCVSVVIFCRKCFVILSWPNLQADNLRIHVQNYFIIPTSLTAEFRTSFHCTLSICLSPALFLETAKENRLKLEYNTMTTRKADDFSITPHVITAHKTAAVPQLTTNVVKISLNRGAIPRIMNIIFRIGGILVACKHFCVCFPLIPKLKLTKVYISKGSKGWMKTWSAVSITWCHRTCRGKDPTWRPSILVVQLFSSRIWRLEWDSGGNKY